MFFPASHGISEQLRDLGFKVDRMKTGTPVRIDGRTIDFAKSIRQDGEDDYISFLICRRFAAPSSSARVGLSIPMKRCMMCFVKDCLSRRFTMVR